MIVELIITLTYATDMDATSGDAITDGFSEQIAEIERMIQEKKKVISEEKIAVTDLEGKLQKIYYDRKTQIFEAKKFDGFESVKKTDLPGLKIEELEYVIYKRFGTGTTVGSGIYRVSLLSRHCVFGDVSTRTLSDAEYKSKLSQYMSEYACRYCHLVSHSKDSCPQIAAKFCTFCKKYKHDVGHCPARREIAHCRKRVKELMK